MIEIAEDLYKMMTMMMNKRTSRWSRETLDLRQQHRDKTLEAALMIGDKLRWPLTL